MDFNVMDLKTLKQHAMLPYTEWGNNKVYLFYVISIKIEKSLSVCLFYGLESCVATTHFQSQISPSYNFNRALFYKILERRTDTNKFFLKKKTCIKVTGCLTQPWCVTRFGHKWNLRVNGRGEGPVRGLDLDKVSLKVLFVLQNGEKRLEIKLMMTDNHILTLVSFSTIL